MILQMLEPGSGGVLTHVAELTEHLLLAGKPAAVAYSSCRKDEGLQGFSNLLREFGAPSIDMRVSNRPSPWDTLALSRTLAFCRRIRPRLIHCHSTKAGILGRCVAKVLGIPAVYTPHAYFGLRPKASITTTFANIVERALGNVGHTVATSYQEQEFATGRLGLTQERVVTIQNGVNFAKYKPVDREEQVRLREALSLPSDAFVVAAVCRFEFQKDPLSLIHGFAAAHQTCPNLHLSLVGRGDLTSEVLHAIDELGVASAITRMEYHGQPHEIYKAADAFVSTSRYEGLPLVVLEALASNLPMVLTNCPGHTDFFDIGLNRLEVVPQESPSDVADGLMRLYHLRHGAVNHRETCRPLFARENTLRRTVALYERLLGENR